MNNYELLKQLNQLLCVDKYSDYCPNGMQVEGISEVNKIITGVSISEKLIDIAIEREASAIIVHHGLFWNKEEYIISGVKRNRLAKLLRHGINLYAYHLPLDNHPTLGNNIQLAKLLEFEVIGQDERQDLLWYGKLAKPLMIEQLANNIANKLQHKPLYFTKEDNQTIFRVAWCTGGAESMFEAAIKLGVDAYITGEVSEFVMNLANESGVAFIAAGHYATERYGIMALTEHLKQKLKMPAEFIELYNPV